MRETAWRRGIVRRSTAWALVAGAAAVAASGCATKRDLRDLRTEVVGMQTRQDSLFQALQRQNRELMDSLRATGELIYSVRGDLGNQLLQLEQQLLTIQELTGQSQRRLAELRQEWNSRSQRLAVPEDSVPEGAMLASPGTAADDLYEAGVDQLQRNNPATARRAFEQLLREHGTHERAPDAQFQLAESYVAERQFDRALEEFERVVQLFPNSPRVPTALYRAGVISEERGDNARARTYFQRVATGYPRSDEANLAGEKLQRLPPR